MYVGSINDIELGLDILLNRENGEKEIYLFEPYLSIFKARCFCLLCPGVNEEIGG